MKFTVQTKMTTGAEVRVLLVRDNLPRPRVSSPDVAVRYWRRHVQRSAWFDPEREMIVVLSLNTKNEIISFSLVSLGILNEALWHAREAFRPAIVQNAQAVVMMHNHPSGDPSPSFGDYEVTAKAHSQELCSICRC